MTRAKMTEGEKIAEMHRGNVLYEKRVQELAEDIDRAIRREKAKAWDECHLWLNDNPDATNSAMDKANPYRRTNR